MTVEHTGYVPSHHEHPQHSLSMISLLSSLASQPVYRLSYSSRRYQKINCSVVMHKVLKYSVTIAFSMLLLHVLSFVITGHIQSVTKYSFTSYFWHF